MWWKLGLPLILLGFGLTWMSGGPSHNDPPIIGYSENCTGEGWVTCQGQVIGRSYNGTQVIIELELNNGLRTRLYSNRDIFSDGGRYQFEALIRDNTITEVRNITSMGNTHIFCTNGWWGEPMEEWNEFYGGSIAIYMDTNRFPLLRDRQVSKLIFIEMGEITMVEEYEGPDNMCGGRIR